MSGEVFDPWDILKFITKTKLNSVALVRERTRDVIGNYIPHMIFLPDEQSSRKELTS